MASQSPKPVEARARTRLPPAKLDSAEKAKTMSAKYSAGPKRIAHSERRGAKRTRPKIDSVPPTKELTAEMASAGPARPSRVMAWPSMAVTTAEAVPGTLRRMVLMELPYWEP